MVVADDDVIVGLTSGATVSSFPAGKCGKLVQVFRTVASDRISSNSGSTSSELLAGLKTISKMLLDQVSNKAGGHGCSGLYAKPCIITLSGCTGSGKIA